MKINKNLIGGIGFALASLIPLSSKAQNVFETEYLRQLKVNREKVEEAPVRDSYIEPTLDSSDFAAPLIDEAKNCLEGKVLNVHFPTNGADLSEADKADLSKYAEDYLKPYYDNSKEKLNSLTLTGFTDCRGDDLENYELSAKRAENTASYLSSLFKDANINPPEIYVSAFGESKSRETADSLELQKDRVVKITPENPVEYALTLSNGKKVLGDQSGSMASGGNPYWRYFQEYEFPEGMDVYTFSKIVSPGNLKKYEHVNGKSYDINNVRAFGKTCYHPAMRELLASDKISQGDTIKAVVHGDNDFPGESSEDIIKTANEKNVVLNMVGVDLSGAYVKDFIKTAKETGGNYYFMKKFNPKTF